MAIIEGATGFGKSPVNIALGNYFKPSFYTTPQIKLVNQLNNDFCPKRLAIDGGKGKIVSLLGRKNYICRKSNNPSDLCSTYEGEEETSCPKEPNCTYWRQKKLAQDSDIAILTFAMLIINNNLNGESKFLDRNLLIIDECQSLESQIAGLFAGFIISPYILPTSIREKLWDEISKQLPKSEKFNDYIPFLKGFKDLLYDYRYLCLNEREKEKLDSISQRISYMTSELEEERVWIVNIIYQKNNKYKGNARQFKPIFVDKFLQRKLWNQTNKIILSSATIPSRNNVKLWLNRLGLGNKQYSFHVAPMEFPVNNRPIITSCMGGKMTSKEENYSWKENLKTIKEILRENYNEKGVIHTHSYKRAKMLNDDLKEFSTFLHDKEIVNKDVIKDWNKSGKKILISPAVKEGVDLKDDLCRFQILLKVPYPSLEDARVKYLLMEEKQWTWYFDETVKDILQMYGRAVRSPTDHAKFYIVDGSFNDIYKKVKFPEYFTNAINIEG